VREPSSGLGADDHAEAAKIERANYESTHFRSRDGDSHKDEVRGESAGGAAVPTPMNGTTAGADKPRRSGELRTQNESDADAHAPDRPKSGS